jgi:hypothetical protein
VERELEWSWKGTIKEIEMVQFPFEIIYVKK